MGLENYEPIAATDQVTLDSIQHAIGMAMCEKMSADEWDEARNPSLARDHMLQRIYGVNDGDDN